MANDNNIQPVADDSQIVLYQPDESVKLEVKLDATHETVWLTQQQIADLFGTKRPAITKHLGNIFKSGELNQNSVSSILEHTASDHRVIIIDGYVSSLTLSVLDVRKSNVTATIYTVGVGQGMQRLMEEHDRLFPDNHIDIRKWRNESHDRWLIIDDSLYHCGHSLNANGGHKISAITLMGTSPEVILSKVE